MEEIFKGLLLIIAVIAGVYNLRGLYPRSRIRLKADLEIYNLLPSDSSEKAIVNKSITTNINNIYGKKTLKVHSWFDLFTGFVLLLISFYGVVSSLNSDQTSWVIGAGLGLILGAAGISNAFDPED